MEPSIGIMQGRLRPRVDNQYQTFPGVGWEKEFEDAALLGYSEIEWVFDALTAEENPLRTRSGRRAIRKAYKRTGVAVRTIMADCFMVHPLLSDPASWGVLEDIARWTVDIGGFIVDLPFLETSAFEKSGGSADDITAVLEGIATVGEAVGVRFGIESDAPTDYLRHVMNTIRSPALGITYDCGNRAGFSYAEEFAAYGDRVVNVHVKDKRAGKTVPLGRGQVKFHDVFLHLAKRGYRGSYIVQGARGDSWDDDMERATTYFGYTHRVVRTIMSVTGQE